MTGDLEELERQRKIAKRMDFLADCIMWLAGLCLALLILGALYGW